MAAVEVFRTSQHNRLTGQCWSMVGFGARSASAPVQDSVRPESTRVNSVGSRFG
ncbi:hypothetical protein HanPSC8_Chr13g0548141 [Helianthus annuus]|nr:hypothetical protein HanPSC8_Chr13g0548141 [Helianthus annuus]